jgi:ribonucleotide monophosphatase NagD (HAD superfamily)
VTNTTKESKAHLYGLLKSIGLEIEKNEIFSSLTAARQLIEKNSLRPMLFLEPEAYEDFDKIDTNNPNAVVVGLSPNKFDYEHLNDAFK